MVMWSRMSCRRAARDKWRAARLATSLPVRRRDCLHHRGDVCVGASRLKVNRHHPRDCARLRVACGRMASRERVRSHMHVCFRGTVCDRLAATSSRKASPTLPRMAPAPGSSTSAMPPVTCATSTFRCRRLQPLVLGAFAKFLYSIAQFLLPGLLLLDPSQRSWDNHFVCSLSLLLSVLLVLFLFLLCWLSFGLRDGSKCSSSMWAFESSREEQRGLLLLVFH